MNVTIQIEAGKMSIDMGRPGVVADQSSESGGRTINNSASSGARSTVALGADDRFTGTIAGPVDMGTRGEPRVTDILVAALRARGHAVDWRDGDDRRGVDRFLTIDGKDVSLQVVTARVDETFWAEVARGSASRTADLAAAAAWLDQAIAEKAAKYDGGSKSTMLLAIDLAHFGVLATESGTEAYRATHGDPARYGFWSIWLVGPTVPLTAPLSPAG